MEFEFDKHGHVIWTPKTLYELRSCPGATRESVPDDRNSLGIPGVWVLLRFSGGSVRSDGCPPPESVPARELPESASASPRSQRPGRQCDFPRNQAIWTW